MAFTLHSDPAHGYLYVTLRDLKRVGLTPVDFTNCSFVGPMGSLYLEEDCDLCKFADAWQKEVGKFEVTMLYIDGPAPCRNLPRNYVGKWNGGFSGHIDTIDSHFDI